MTGAANVLGPWLLAATLAVPLLFLAACLSERLRGGALALQWLAPIPALGAAILAIGGGPFAVDWPALRMSLKLDLPGALILAAASLLWIVVGAATFSGEARKPNERFAVSWLLTLTGSLGVFVAADLLTFYLVYALVSIPAYELIIRDGSPSSRRAGGVYMAFTILGEALLLMAFALLAAGEPNGSLRIDDVMAALPASPWRDGALALVIAGFGMKMALVPLNGWMPLTYAAAPIPAAAVLSGAAVKAGVIGFIRFLPFAAPLQGWGEALAAVGFVSAFYGVAIGITQQNPKTILAYSSISQMGVIAAVVGMALASGDAGAPSKVAFYAANHVLVKGALFLAVGVAAATDLRRDRWPLILTAVLALSLAGLPLTGGALAKLAVKGPLGYGLAASLANVSAAATALLMLHFVTRLAGTCFSRRRDGGAGLDRPALARNRDRRDFHPLAPLSRRRKPPGCSERRHGVGRAVAARDRRRAGAGASALGGEPSAHSGRRHDRRGGGGVQGELCLERVLREPRRAVAPMAGRDPVASGDRAPSGRDGGLRRLSVRLARSVMS